MRLGRRRLLGGAVGRRPGHGQPVASANLFQPLGDAPLDLVRAGLVRRLGAQR
jgi:hypothetical protein